MLKNRVKKLNEKITPATPIIVLMEDAEPTEEQKQKMARAKMLGIEPHIIRVIKASEGKGCE